MLFGDVDDVADVWASVRAALETSHAKFLDPGRVHTDVLDRGQLLYGEIYSRLAQDFRTLAQFRSRVVLWAETYFDSAVTGEVRTAIDAGSPTVVCRAIARHVDAFKRFKFFAQLVLLYVEHCVGDEPPSDPDETQDSPPPDNNSRVPLSQLFNERFRSALFQGGLKRQLRESLIREVNHHRDGDARVDIGTLRAAVEAFIQVALLNRDTRPEQRVAYLRSFEDAYVTSAGACAKQRSTALLAADGAHDGYVQWVEARMIVEQHLAEQLLRDDGAQRACNAIVVETLVADKLYDGVIDDPRSGCGALLQNWKLEDLGRMYRLMKRVREQKALHMMGKALQARVQAEATEAMQNFNSATSDGPLSLERPLVTAMVELNAKYGGLIQERFEGSGIFYDCRKKAFNAVLKQKLERTDPKLGAGEGATEKKATSFPEVLATFCDAVMKRELKDVVDADAELERLDALLQVFTYVEEKDVFQEFYKARLAKRLLQTTPNEDLEKAFLERLQREMGKSFTHKMEGMLLDRESTKKHSEEFNRDAAGSSLESDFDVQVLTEANWPAYRADALTPPLSLRRCMDAFTRFYKKKYATRKLTWFNLLGSGVLRVTFAKGAKDVTLSLHQAAVLLTIDERGRASVREVGESMGLDAKGAKPHVASMYLHKAFGMLRRVDASGAPQPVAKTIGDEDLLELNDGFVHKMRKFKVPQAHVSSHGSGGMPTEQEIDARRKIQVDACVVRIMKSRKSLSYPELQDLVIQQLGKIFTPQPKLVKQRVEDLVTREYLQRHEDDAKMFDYLA